MVHHPFQKIQTIIKTCSHFQNEGITLLRKRLLLLLWEAKASKASLASGKCWSASGTPLILKLILCSDRWQVSSSQTSYYVSPSRVAGGTPESSTFVKNTALKTSESYKLKGGCKITQLYPRKTLTYMINLYSAKKKAVFKQLLLLL